MEGMGGHIQGRAFADFRPGRRCEHKINFEVLEPMGRICNEMEGTVEFVTCDRRMVVD